MLIDTFPVKSVDVLPVTDPVNDIVFEEDNLVAVAAFPDMAIDQVPVAPVPSVGTRVVVPEGRVALVVAVVVRVRE